MIKKQLLKIVFGLVFIFFNFNLQFSGGGYLNFLPNFIGYLVIYRALSQLVMETNSLQFERSKKFSFIMFFVTLGIFLMDLFGLSTALGMDLVILSLTIAIGSLVLQLIFLYFLTLGIASLTSDAKLASRVQLMFRFVAIGNVLVYLLVSVNFLAIMILATIVVNILYMNSVYRVAQSID